MVCSSAMIRHDLNLQLLFSNVWLIPQLLYASAWFQPATTHYWWLACSPTTFLLDRNLEPLATTYWLAPWLRLCLVRTCNHSLPILDLSLDYAFATLLAISVIEPILAQVWVGKSWGPWLGSNPQPNPSPPAGSLVNPIPCLLLHVSPCHTLEVLVCVLILMVGRTCGVLPE